MPSFSWTSKFREGQWRAFRKFLLEERRDASSRFLVIDAERERIGDVHIRYTTKADGTLSEKRVGIVISDPQSSIGKLFQAYTALGGNPFDISMFMAPERSILNEEGEPEPTMPGGGMAYPQNIRYSYDQGVQDGDGNLLKSKESRSGGRNFSDRETEVLVMISQARKWVTKEIHWKRTRIEEMIIKMVDLREQLDQEVEELVWATGGVFPMDEEYDDERYSNGLTAGAIVYTIDGIFRVPDLSDPTSIPVNAEAGEDEAGSPNTEALGSYPSLISDHEDEENTAL